MKNDIISIIKRNYIFTIIRKIIVVFFLFKTTHKFYKTLEVNIYNT